MTSWLYREPYAGQEWMTVAEAFGRVWGKRMAVTHGERCYFTLDGRGLYRVISTGDGWCVIDIDKRWFIRED